MAQKSWKFTVEPSEAGLRLDQLLSEHSGLSRRRVREALKLGGVQAEGRRIRVASRTLKPGTLVRLAIDGIREAVRRGDQGMANLAALGEPERTERALADFVERRDAVHALLQASIPAPQSARTAEGRLTGRPGRATTPHG